MWQIWHHQHLEVKNIRQVICQKFVGEVSLKEKSFNTHLLQIYFSELKEKNPNSMQGAWAGGRGKYQPAHFPSERLSQHEDPNAGWKPLPSYKWVKLLHNLCCKLCEERATRLLNMVTASTSMYSAEEGDCSSPVMICPFFGILLLATKQTRTNLLNTLKQNKIKFSF